MRTLLWLLGTCLTWMALAVLFWKLDMARHADAWYMMAAAPVFLFSWLLSRIARRIRRGYDGI